MKEKLGKVLRELRQRNKLTQEQVAEKLSIDRTNISRYESGKQYPEPERLDALARCYGYGASGILRLAEGDETPSVREPRATYGLSFPAFPADDFDLLLPEDQERFRREWERLKTEAQAFTAAFEQRVAIARAYRDKFGAGVADNKRVAEYLPPAPHVTEKK